MTIKDFEKSLQETVDKTINFRAHPVNKDIVGIYYGDVYTETAIPSQEIQPTRNENYTDNFGTPHRAIDDATERVKSFITRFNNEEEFRNDVLGYENPISES